MSKEFDPCEDCNRNCEVPCWKVDHGLLVEVVHARWYRPYTSWFFPFKIKNPYCYCTNCAQPIKPKRKTNYCPDCGAKMDGEEKR